jgi:hypothetical protein|tara:strand:+ start:872 stop:1249 length:378 start_codon:yes stop_codon:yes gene_type:complete
MAIKINQTTPIENDHRQWVFMTISVLDEDCKWVYTAPANLNGDDLQSYLDANEDMYKRVVLRKMYKGSDVYNGTLKELEAWVSAGCKNADDEVIPKKEWVDIEPPVDQAALIAELQEKVKALESK